MGHNHSQSNVIYNALSPYTVEFVALPFVIVRHYCKLIAYATKDLRPDLLRLWQSSSLRGVERNAAGYINLRETFWWIHFAEMCRDIIVCDLAEVVIQVRHTNRTRLVLLRRIVICILGP